MPISMVRKGKEMQTPKKSGRVVAEQLVKQRSAQVIWNRGALGRDVSSNHEIDGNCKLHSVPNYRGEFSPDGRRI